MQRTHTVLIVDDSYDDRFILKRYLQKTGLSLVILEASSGPEGIELLMLPLKDLVVRYPGINTPVTLFLDINMPVMDGWGFVEELEKIREVIELKPAIVLMYSTSDAEHEKKKAQEYDVVASYIVKGESTPESLKQAILANQI